MTAAAILAVSAIGLFVWRYGMYSGDDRITLFAVAQHSLDSTFKDYIRPLEYLAVEAANRLFLPIWIAISIAAAVTAAMVNVRTAEMVTNSRLDRRLRLLAVVGSPLWFYTVSQVDTVSQALCNLLFSAALFCLAGLLFNAKSPETTRLATAINVICSLLLYTKELALAAALVLPAIAAFHQLRARRWSYYYVLSGVTLAVAVMAWIALKLVYRGMLPEADGRLNMTPGVLDVVRNTVATFAFPLVPLPSSFLSFSRLESAWVVCGVLATSYFFWSMRRLDWRATQVRWFVLAVLGSCFPMFYVHASELYASMVGSLFLTMLLLLTPENVWLKRSYCALLLACSYANCAAYFNYDLIEGANLERKAYSVYFGPNGLYFGKQRVAAICPVRTTRSVAWSGERIVCQ